MKGENVYEVSIMFTVEAEDDAQARDAAEEYLSTSGAPYIIEGASISEIPEGEDEAAEQVSIEPTDPFRRNGMFTPEGNVEVELLIRNMRVFLAPTWDPLRCVRIVPVEADAYERISDLQAAIGEGYPEVNDTEPEVAICEALDEVWNDLYGHDCERSF